MAFVINGSDPTDTNNLTMYSGSPISAASLLAQEDFGGNSTFTSSQAFVIGGADFSGNRTPPILLDDVRVYDGLLTASEVEAVRASNIPEPATLGLIGVGIALVIGRGGRRSRRA